MEGKHRQDGHIHFEWDIVDIKDGEGNQNNIVINDKVIQLYKN